MAKGYRRSITIDFDTSQVAKGSENVKAAIRALDSEFKKSSNEIKKYGDSSQDLALKKDFLTKKIELQQQKVDDLTVKYSKAKDELGEYSKTTLKSKDELNKAETALGTLKDQLSETNKEIEKQSGAFGTVITRIDDFKARAKEAGVDIDKLADTFMKVGGVMVGIGVISAKMAMDFDAEMGKVIASTGRTGDEIEKLREIILTAAKQYGISAAEMAGAAVEVAWDWENAAVKLDNAARLSIAGVTDVATAAGVLESITSSYNMTIEQQVKLVDQLVIAQQKGRGTINDFGTSLGNVTSIAAESGVAIEELLAIISAVTNAGVPASTAISSLRQVISAIIKPTSDATQTAERLGIQFNAAALESGGLVKILEDARSVTKGNADELAKLFGNVTALSQVMAITGSDYEYFKETLNAIKDAGGEANITIEAMRSPSQKLNESMNNLKISLIEAGGAFQPVINAVAKFIGHIANLPTGVVVAISVFGGLLVVLGALVKAYTLLKSTQEAYLAIKAIITGLTAKEAITNTGLAASQTATATSGGILAAVNTLLGTSFTSMIPILLIVAAVIAAIAIAWALITGRSKEAERTMEESTRSISNNINGLQRDVENSMRNISITANNLPHYATGTSYHHGGLALVGDDGPEIIDMPTGTRVYNARQTRRILQSSGDLTEGRESASAGGDSYQFNITVRADEINEISKFINMMNGLKQSARAYAGGRA